MKLETVPCKNCGTPTRMLGTQQCDPCWEERRSGKLDVAEARIAQLEAALIQRGHQPYCAAQYHSFTAAQRMACTCDLRIAYGSSVETKGEQNG